jgi:hypothetical protein
MSFYFRRHLSDFLCIMAELSTAEVLLDITYCQPRLDVYVILVQAKFFGPDVIIVGLVIGLVSFAFSFFLGRFCSAVRLTFSGVGNH